MINNAIHTTICYTTKSIQKVLHTLKARLDKINTVAYFKHSKDVLTSSSYCV